MAGKPQSAEMNPGPGFRIRYDVERADPDLVAAFAPFEIADISDLMNRLYTMRDGIRPVTDPELRLLGTACTVRCYPGDNLMVHKSLDVAQPGDVIVVDTSGSNTSAVLGELVSLKARHRGVAGFVVDGLIRDLTAVRAMGDFPVFARGATPIGPLHRGPGEINYPVCAGGIVVSPGDILVGDLNGVVCIPREIAPELLVRLIDRTSEEASYVAAVERGQFSNAWVDDVLESAGVTIEDAAGV